MSKNCPFCGGESLITYGQVFCPNRDCIIGTMHFPKSKWNNRPREEELLNALREIIYSGKEPETIQHKLDDGLALLGKYGSKE